MGAQTGKTIDWVVRVFRKGTLDQAWAMLLHGSAEEVELELQRMVDSKHWNRKTNSRDKPAFLDHELYDYIIITLEEYMSQIRLA